MDPGLPFRRTGHTRARSWAPRSSPPHATLAVHVRVSQRRAGLETDGPDAGAEWIRDRRGPERLDRDIDIPDHQRTTRTGLMRELARRDLGCRTVIYEAISALHSGMASFSLDVVDSASSPVVPRGRGAMCIADAGGHTIAKKTLVSPRQDRLPGTPLAGMICGPTAR